MEVSNDEFEYDFLLSECTENIIEKVSNKEKIKGRKPSWMKDVITVINKSKKGDETSNVYQYLKSKLNNSQEICEFVNKCVNVQNTQKKFNKFKDLWKFRNIIQFHHKDIFCVDKFLLNRVLQYKEISQKIKIKNIVIKIINKKSLDPQDILELNAFFESLYT